MTINAVRPLILGRAGTSVTLGLRRESEDSVVYVRIMREPVRLGEVLVPGMRVNPVLLLKHCSLPARGEGGKVRARQHYGVKSMTCNMN